MVRIAPRFAPSSSVGRGNPSPRPSPAALRAANDGVRVSSPAANRRWWNPGERRERRGARLTRRVREEYRVYFDRNATQNGAKRSGSAGMDRRSNAAWVSSPAVNRRWQNPRGPVAVKMQLPAGTPTAQMVPAAREPPPGELGRPPVGTRGSAKPALVTPSSADVSGAPPFHAGGVNGPTRSGGLLPVGPGTRGSAKPALVTPSSADVSGAPPFHAGGVNGPTRSGGLPVGARPAIHPAQTTGAHLGSTTGC